MMRRILIHRCLRVPDEEYQSQAAAPKISKLMMSVRSAVWFMVSMFTVVSAFAVDVDWFTVDGGGAMSSSGGDFEVSGTIGQTDAVALMTGADFELTGGFWAGVAARGDCDGDGDVDLDEYATMSACIAGPGGGLGSGCGCFDFDGDGDNDMLDFAEFQVIFTGP